MRWTAEQAGGAADHGATWRERGGDVVAATYGGTLCWFPRRPWRLRIADDQFQHVIRCGECPGCLEFDRRRLADRLVQAYHADRKELAASSSARVDARSPLGRRTKGELFAVRVFCPVERHASLYHNLARRPLLDARRGFFRLGRGSFAFLTSRPGSVGDALKAARLKYRVERIRLSRGRRAWRSITAGILVAREAYGENLNRWYARGLPKADRRKWNVIKLSKYKPYDRRRSPRAWKRGDLFLVPPAYWTATRATRQAIRKTMAIATSPELAAAIQTVVAGMAGASPGSLPSDRNRTPRSGAPFKNISPSFEGGRYLTSRLTQGELIARARSDPALLETGSSGRPVWMERELDRLKGSDDANEARRRRVVEESMSIIERLAQKAKERERGNPG